MICRLLPLSVLLACHTVVGQYGSYNNGQRVVNSGQLTNQQISPYNAQSRFNQPQQYVPQAQATNQRYQQQQYQQGQSIYANQQYQPQQTQQTSNSAPGLLSNPERPASNRITFAANESQSTFYLRLNQYINNGWQLGDGASCSTSCAFAFTFVVAALDATIYYNSTTFYTVSQLGSPTWNAMIELQVVSKPVYVDIFVHSLSYSLGDANGTAFYVRTPLTHVDTFVLDLKSYSPFLNPTSVTPTQVTLTGQKPVRTTINIEYYVLCGSGVVGPSCELKCVEASSTTALCTSIFTHQRELCTYSDSTKTQVQNCQVCLYDANNGTCSLIAAYPQTGVSTAFRTWTIVLAILLLIALLIILLLICAKLFNDWRKRQNNQLPKNRNPSAFSGGYRPNAIQGNTPLLDTTQDQEWQTAHRPPPAVIRRTAQVHDTEPINTSLQDGRLPYPHSHTASNRREAQV